VKAYCPASNGQKETSGQEQYENERISGFSLLKYASYRNAAEFAKMAALPNSGAGCVVLHIWFVHEPAGADAIRVLQSQ